MKRRMILIAVVVVLLAVAFFAMSDNATLVSAKPADAYTIDWYTIDGGGAMFSTGGSYELSGTIGQYDAGSLSGGSYKVNGGFWGFLDSLSKLYLPMIMK